MWSCAVATCSARRKTRLLSLVSFPERAGLRGSGFAVVEEGRKEKIKLQHVDLYLLRTIQRAGLYPNMCPQAVDGHYVGACRQKLKDDAVPSLSLAFR